MNKKDNSMLQLENFIKNFTRDICRNMKTEGKLTFAENKEEDEDIETDEEDVEEIEESTSTSSVGGPGGGYAYDAPAFLDAETANHTNLIRRSIQKEINKLDRSKKLTESYIKETVIRPLAERLVKAKLQEDYKYNTYWKNAAKNYGKDRKKAEFASQIQTARDAEAAVSPNAPGDTSKDFNLKNDLSQKELNALLALVEKNSPEIRKNAIETLEKVNNSSFEKELNVILDLAKRNNTRVVEKVRKFLERRKLDVYGKFENIIKSTNTPVSKEDLFDIFSEMDGTEQVSELVNAVTIDTKNKAWAREKEMLSYDDSYDNGDSLNDPPNMHTHRYYVDKNGKRQYYPNTGTREYGEPTDAYLKDKKEWEKYQKWLDEPYTPENYPYKPTREF